MKYDLVKIAEEAAVCSVMTKEAVSPRNVAIPMENMAIGGLAGLGIGGLGSLARDVMTGDKVSYKRALIGALLGGGAGASIPLAYSLGKDYNPSSWFTNMDKPGVKEDRLEAGKKYLQQLEDNKTFLTERWGRYLPFAGMLADSEGRAITRHSENEGYIRTILEGMEDLKPTDAEQAARFGKIIGGGAAGWWGSGKIADMVSRADWRGTVKAVEERMLQIKALRKQDVITRTQYNTDLDSLTKLRNKVRKILRAKSAPGFWGGMIATGKGIGNFFTGGGTIKPWTPPGALAGKGFWGKAFSAAGRTAKIPYRLTRGAGKSIFYTGPKAAINAAKQTMSIGKGLQGSSVADPRLASGFGSGIIRWGGRTITVAMVVRGVLQYIEDSGRIEEAVKLEGRIQAGDLSAVKELAEIIREMAGVTASTDAKGQTTIKIDKR